MQQTSHICPECEAESAAMEEIAAAERLLADVNTDAGSVQVWELNGGKALSVSIEARSGWAMPRVDLEAAASGRFAFWPEPFEGDDGKWLNIEIHGEDDCEHVSVFDRLRDES